MVIRSVIAAPVGIMIPVCAAFGSLLLQAGCVGESTDGCPRKSVLYISVETENGPFFGVMEGATVFLFDAGRTFLYPIQVSAGEIADKAAIPIVYDSDNHPWAFVWANLGDGEQVTSLSAGDLPEGASVSMKKAAGGYSATPDNLFFGWKRLSGMPVEHIVITPKTGRISVTARGLTPGAAEDEYYYTADTPYDGYDFTGKPLPGQAILKFPAMFRSGDLVMPEAGRLFHFPAPSAEPATVRLYRKAAGSDDALLLAEADRDINGRPIAVLREKTTNVLFDFGPTGSLEVIVAVTGWNEIAQWGNW